jgi:c-di-AMP phosphodiesterase-like protein
MNKNIKNLVEPGKKLFLIILLLFAAATCFFEWRLAAAEAGVIVVLIIFSAVDTRRRQHKLMEYIESVTYNTESAKNDTLLHFPLPMVMFRLEDERIVWGNQAFFTICGRQKPTLEASMESLVGQDFSGKWLMEGKNQYPGLLELGDRKYQIHGNIVRQQTEDENSHNFMGITYWVDVTDYDDIRLEYEASRPVVAVILLDNYDELTKNASDRVKLELRGAVEDKITQWVEGMDGFLRRFDRDRYVFIFEQRHLQSIVDSKFSILESAREVVSPTGIHATVSVGIGVGGSGYEENYSFASLGVDMALSRGGDQAVVKNRLNFEFYGGRGSEIETRTKVKSRVTANALAELMRDSSQVFIMGHRFGDMDAVGGAVGLCCIARKLDVRARIVIDPENNAAQKLINSLKQVPEYKGAFITPQAAMLAADSRTLLVVVDTNRPEQVEDENLLMACTRVAVIDHHRRAASYIQNADLTFHEPYASSVCELMTELLQEIVETQDIMRCEAEAMLCGIVMDTKNFTMRTGERTFDAAAFLRRAGADTTGVKKMLQNDLDATVAKYTILQSAKIYRGSIAIAAPEQEQDRVVAAQAADELLNVSGVQASIVLFPTADGGVTISARSIGEVNVQVLLEGLGGGGNTSAAGAQLKNISLREAVNRVCEAIDKYLDD